MKLEGTSLKRDFIKYIIPAVVAQWVFALYTMVDGMFVARGVSEVALAAVNLSSPFVMGLFAVSLMFAVGTSTIVAMLFGEKKIQEAKEVFSQNIVVLIILSLLITALVLLNLEGFCRFLGATENTLPYVKEYVGTIAPFAVFFILSYSFEILISTDGYPALATIIVTIGVVANCILDYLLIIVFDLGVFGAAFATGFSQLLVVCVYLIHFLGKKGTIKFCRFKVRPKVVLREMRNGFPSGITELSAGIVTFVFNQFILMYLTEDALVSYSIIAYINGIVVMSMTGIAQGAQPLVSYYYGKKEMDKCRKLLKYGFTAMFIASIAALSISYFGADLLVRVFISADMSDLIVYSAKVFRIFIFAFLLVGYNIEMAGFFTAIERPVAAVLISLGRGCVTLVISMIILTTIFGGTGIWWGALLSEALCLIISLTLFKKMKVFR